LRGTARKRQSWANSSRWERGARYSRSHEKSIVSPPPSLI